MKTSTNPNATPTERALGRCYSEFVSNFGQLETFRIVATAGTEAGLPSVEGVISVQLEKVIEDYRAAGEDADRLRIQFAEALRGRKRLDTELAIHAATVVFAHAVLERLIHDLMSILADAAPAAVAPRIQERKVRLGDLRTLQPSEIEAREAKSYVVSLTRESLMTKVSFLFYVCSFRETCQRDGYRYDEAALKKIDTDRQDLMHRRLFSASQPSNPLDLTFVQYTGFFFISTVASYLDANIDLWHVVAPFLPPDRIAYNALDEAVTGVQTAMRAWNERYQEGHGTDEQRQQIIDAYAKFQAVARAAIENARGATALDPDLVTIALTSASQLIALISSAEGS